MSEIIQPKVGVLGAGQLARMMVQAAPNLIVAPHIIVLDKRDPSGAYSPAAQVGAEQIFGDFNDPEAIRELAERSDVVTIDLEHVNAGAMYMLAQEGRNMQPNPKTILKIQDKLFQKQHYDRSGLRTTDFEALDDADDLESVRWQFDGKVIVKARTGSYDGRGNLVIDDSMTWTDIKQRFTKDGHMPKLYAERLIDFKRELSQVGVRDLEGNIFLYPLVETDHKNNICHTVVAPAGIEPWLAEDARELGRQTIASFRGAGVFAVEMFQDQRDRMIINEVAPRVHNSAHWTIDGAETSQFEQQLRAILGEPLGGMGMRDGIRTVRMVNLLGSRTGVIDRNMLELIDDITDKNPDVHVNLYGKTLRPERKVGHVNVTGDSPEEVEDKANWVMAQIHI